MVDQGTKSLLDSSQDYWLVCIPRLWYKWPKDLNYKKEERCWHSPKCKQFGIADFSELFSITSGHLNCVLLIYFILFFLCSTFPSWLCFWNNQILSKLRSLDFYTPPPSTTLLNSYLHRCLMAAWSLMTGIVFTVVHVPDSSDGEESACNAQHLGSIPGLGRSPEEGHGNPLEYSCLENSVDRRAWQATYSPWSCKGSDTTEQLSLSLFHSDCRIQHRASNTTPHGRLFNKWVNGRGLKSLMTWKWIRN